MASWRHRVGNLAALGLGVTAASTLSPQLGNAAEQSGAVIFWDATKCAGGYESNSYSVHCEPGPFGTVLDFKTKLQFFCVNNAAVDARWAILPDAKPGPPISPSQIIWKPECWKAPLGFDVDPNTSILTPQYSQSPPPNYYMTMNVVVLYDAAKPTIKACLLPLFPRFPVEPACADAEIRS